MGQPSQKYTFFHLSLDESQHIGMKFIFLRTQGAGTLCVRHAGTSECCALEWSLGYDKTETEANGFRLLFLSFGLEGQFWFIVSYGYAVSWDRLNYR